MSNKWFKREEKRQVTFRIGEDETEIGLLKMIEHPWSIQNVKEIPMEFQHVLVIADIDKKIRKIVRKTCNERREISLLRDVKIRKLFEQKVI